MNTIGNNIKVTFFGESHGPYLGVVIDNLPAGLEIDYDLIKSNLSKRRPSSNISTDRVEKDKYTIVSGFLNGLTTGAALTVLIENTNTRSKDYEFLNITPRPSHADYPAYTKYNGFNDYRGSGFFSGRVTALWIVVGSICQQILNKHNIFVGSHVLSIKDVVDDKFESNTNNLDQLKLVVNDVLPVINNVKGNEMIKIIEEAKANSDSVGGVVESKIINLPVGLGEPYFLSTESYISNLLFAVPAVKGVEFGKGFDITKNFGSEMNDEYIIQKGDIQTKCNNNGGILGGLTNGSPIIIRAAFKPASSIAKPQKTVNLLDKTETTLEIHGRHDPQVVSRAVPVVNSVLYFAILDLLLFQKNKSDLI